MNKSELLKGLSIEELQERNEFTVAPGDGSCYHKCVFSPEPTQV